MIRIEEDVRPGMRLGRHRDHDPRSRSFAVQAASLGSLTSVRHHRLVPVYDQGSVGSCTGNACAGALSTAPFRHRYHEPTAVRLYSEATRLDDDPASWPPSDTGSTGLAVAKAARARGLCSSYDHAFSLEAALTALQTSAVLLGISWRTGCDTPDTDGLIRWAGTVRGGHEVVLDEINVEERLAWLTNSWGAGFGVNGRAALSWDDLGAALADSGDLTVLVP